MALTRIQGAVVTFDDGASTAQTVDVISFSLDEGTAAVIGDTRVSSIAIRRVMGLPGGGTASLECQGDLDDAAIVALQDAYSSSALRTLIVTYPSGTLNTLTCEAGVASITYAGETNGKAVFTFALEIDAEIAIS